MPENTAKVDRTTPFGNPFVVGHGQSREYCVQLFRILMGGFVCLNCHTPTDKQRDYLDMLKAESEKGFPTLRGKNLACWCPVGAPCHADLLLKIVNKRTRVRMEMPRKKK